MPRIPPRKPIRKTTRRARVPRLKLRIAKVIDELTERVPENQFTIAEKDILRRIREKLSGAVYDTTLTEADYTNMKRIAKRYKINF